MPVRPAAVRPAAVHLRAPRVEDARAVAELHVGGWRDGCSGAIEQGYLDALSVAGAEQRWRAQLGHPAPAAHTVVAADDADRAVGMISTAPALAAADRHNGRATGEIVDFFVARDHRGTGVAGALHAAALDALTARGHHRAVVWVVTGNTRALRYYVRHGWCDDAVVRTAVDGTTRWRELRLSLDLTAGPDTAQPSV